MIRWALLVAAGAVVMALATIVYVRRPEPEYPWPEPEDGVQPADPYPLGAAECAEGDYYSLLDWLTPGQRIWTRPWATGLAPDSMARDDARMGTAG